MVSHFSANQYEDAFRPKKLRNWTVPRKYKERPSTFEGYTQIIANDRGHLIAGAPKSKENPWGTFMGTWDMPCKIPPARPSYTARSYDAARHLATLKQTSPLNHAANGYKKFEKFKKVQTSPFERPRSPTPPPSTEKLFDPSAGVVTKSPQLEHKSPEYAVKSPCQKSPVRTPTPQKARSVTPVGTPSPRSLQSHSPRPASHLSEQLPPDNRSVNSARTV